MATNDYHFITRWRVESTCEEVYEILSKAEDMPRWWPSVYLEIKVYDDGKLIDLYTKGWLPYTLRWKARLVENQPPHRLVIEALGDFTGKGAWTLTQDGKFVNIVYDWKIQANKPLLKNLSFLLKPIFSLNHQWAMARGEESLKLELARRHAKTDAERTKIPPPPQPTGTSPLPMLALGTGIFGGSAAGIAYVLNRNNSKKKTDADPR
jgi:uncharacterized protein YndB with AHSA1/START domain